MGNNKYRHMIVQEIGQERQLDKMDDTRGRNQPIQGTYS